jgi:transitional endoplasmic reticulum ATPase
MSDASPRLPSWAVELRDRYLAGEASLFLVHGNVRDLVAWDAGNGKTEWVSLKLFFERFLGRTRDIVVYYNVSQGMLFPDSQNQRRFERAINARRATTGADLLGALPRLPTQVIPLVEEIITDPLHSSGVVLDYVETVAPSGDLSFMTAEDKATLVSLQRWASDPAFLSTDNLVILVTEHLSDVSRRVVSSAQLMPIVVPFPGIDERLAFLQGQNLSEVKLQMDLPALAKVTAGLSLLQIRSILRGAQQTGEEITFRTVSRRKKSIIEQECHGLVEFVDPEHNFSHVGGMEGVKETLMRVAEAVKTGNRNRVPMGMIFVGAMGTGKTYLAEAFAAECGLTCLKFKNFREKWVGSTEANLEKVLDLVDALGYVLLIIDEADRSLSAGESDGGTSSRVIARLKEFMSDTTHRGRVVMLMMTNRPDKLDTDLKRPGRFDLKIPFFFPEDPTERQAILKAASRKNNIPFDGGISWDHAVTATAGYSSAELEAVVLAAVAKANENDGPSVNQDDLDSAVSDVIPSRDTRMLGFMEMLAVFESSSRKMLPERYRTLSTDEVQARLDLLREQLGRRAIL